MFSSREWVRIVFADTLVMRCLEHTFGGQVATDSGEEN